ncbi:replication protein [Rhodococcus hoagii]|nr:replication protein [Prescottella equi]
MANHILPKGGIRRGPRRTADFTTLSNAVINDARLSFRARGVLMWLLSKPSDWRTLSTAIAAQSPREGRDAIRTAMRELEEYGYLVRERVRDAGSGQFAMVQTIHEVPVTAVEASIVPAPDYPDSGNPATGKPVATQRTESRRIETKPTPTTGTSPTRREPRRVGVEVNPHTEGRLDSLAAACRKRGLAARWDRLKPDQAADIAALLETHGVAALADAAVRDHRPSNPTRYAQGYLGMWSAIPTARVATVGCSGSTGVRTCDCGDCDGRGWLPDPDDTGPARRCSAWRAWAAVAA